MCKYSANICKHSAEIRKYPAEIRKYPAKNVNISLYIKVGRARKKSILLWCITGNSANSHLAGYLHV